MLGLVVDCIFKVSSFQPPVLSWAPSLANVYVSQDVKFGVFRNEHGNAEFAMQVVKDAKGMTFTPSKRRARVSGYINPCNTPTIR